MEGTASENDYSQPPGDMAELMARVEREWAALEHAIEQVSEEQMSVPDPGGWSIKDNLAHLTAWERYLRLHHLRNQPPHEVMGVDEETFAKTDEDGLNAILVQRNGGRPVGDVLAELRQSHQQVLADLAPMPFADLTKPRYADNPEAGALIGWVMGNTYEHYQDRRAAIERQMERLETSCRGGRE